MTAFNIVRFRVRPGREEEFLEAHRQADVNFAGMRRGALIKTGDRAYCLVGEWDAMDDIVGARGEMVAVLNSFRGTLEDLGDDLGVTDPESGEVIMEMK